MAVIARWLDWERSHRAQRALDRQRRYQEQKSRSVDEYRDAWITAMQEGAAHLRDRLEAFRPIGADARVLEVGSGPHGFVFYFEARQRVGVDPLAHDYAALFPWQREAKTVAAVGHALPFPDGRFEVAICHNVVDHAENPQGIVSELARVLAPGGCLYFTVNVHHPVYAVAAALHRTWNAAGIPFEIGPFADHTVHLTPERGRRLFRGLPLTVLTETCDADAALEAARRIPARHVGDTLKRWFFKNAILEVIAQRRA